jgi:hypothetical protein
MATITEGVYRGEGIVQSEEFSFQEVTVLSGQTLAAMEVIGLVKVAGIGRASIPTVAGGTGTGTMSLVTVGPDAQVGSYVVQCTAAATHGGVFSVTAPDGKLVGSITMTGGTGATTAFASSHINFSLTDATDFITANSFTIVVGTTAPTIIGGTGTATMSALSAGPDAKRGNYKVICIEAITNGGRWQVFDPDGNSIGEYLMDAGSTTTTAFTNDQINFSLTDATDVIVGNYFDIAVYGPAANPKAVQYDPRPTTQDGRQDVAGVMLGAVDASGGDVVGVAMVRRGVVHEGKLAWKSTVSAAEKAVGKAQLTALGIVVAAAA